MIKPCECSKGVIARNEVTKQSPPLLAIEGGRLLRCPFALLRALARNDDVRGYYVSERATKDA
jgi:hypothetical protein